MNEGRAAEVLLVDDDADLRDALAEMLQEEGFSVAVATHGVDALDYLEEARCAPAVILLDLMMPQMDGFEFRRRQLASPAHAAIPVIVMTASSHVTVEAPALQPAAIVRKPFKIEALISVLRRLGVQTSR